MTGKKISTGEMKMKQDGHRPAGSQARSRHTSVKPNLFLNRCLNRFATCLVKMGNLTRSMAVQPPVGRIFVASGLGQKLA